MGSLSRMAAIATNTLREAVRNRLLYALLFFSVSMMCAGIFVSSLAYVEGERILQNVGLAATRLFSVAIAIFVGVNLIHKAVDRRTVYTILSKPLTRAEFVVGKFAGLVAMAWVKIVSVFFQCWTWFCVQIPQATSVIVTMAARAARGRAAMVAGGRCWSGVAFVNVQSDGSSA